MGNERAFGRLCVAPSLRKLPFREVAFNDSLLRSGPPMTLPPPGQHMGVVQIIQVQKEYYNIRGVKRSFRST